MYSRNKMRTSLTTEDESSKNQRILEEKLLLKKQLLRSEFETFEQEFLSEILCENEVKFKKELDFLKTQKNEKRKKLAFLRKSEISSMSFIHKSREIKGDQIKEKTEEKAKKIDEEIEGVQRDIQSQILMESSIKARIEEFVADINGIRKKNKEMRYLCDVSEKRFKFLDVIKSNAFLKKVHFILFSHFCSFSDFSDFRKFSHFCRFFHFSYFLSFFVIFCHFS